jgi:hypothetical protein
VLAVQIGAHPVAPVGAQPVPDEHDSLAGVEGPELVQDADEGVGVVAGLLQVETEPGRGGVGGTVASAATASEQRDCRYETSPSSLRRCRTVCVRWLLLPVRCDRAGGALISALRAVVPRRGGAAGRTRDRGRPNDPPSSMTNSTYNQRSQMVSNGQAGRRRRSRRPAGAGTTASSSRHAGARGGQARERATPAWSSWRPTPGKQDQLKDIAQRQVDERPDHQIPPTKASKRRRIVVLRRAVPAGDGHDRLLALHAPFRRSVEP